ncbi:MAG: TonB-dependent receptor [Acidobacteriaceae bacterium]|nr:TonB-dependent receptor [Acidobacteriaceae bacterium]
MNCTRVLAVLSLLPCLLMGQTQSRLAGLVTDDSGAVVVGARVTARNVQTGVTTTATTGEAGNYLFPALLPGGYEVSVEKAGFKRAVQAGLTLETGITRTVDLRLSVGAVSETVEVKAQAALLESETSSVGQLIERTTVLNMPLESRRTAGLVRLLGAVTFTSETGGEQVPMFSMAGGRSQNQMWQLDGAVVQNMSLGVAQLQLNPPAESLQEFKAEMSNFSAEFGRAGGGLILMTTRSGTNEYHGAAYEFLRNQALDTRTFFAPRKAPLRYNIFGASFGGPIRKDRTFFFANYEGARRRDGVTISGLIMPHAPERTGDFSNRRDVAVLDPVSAQPFPGNIIPPSRIDPIARQLAALYPAANVASDITRAPSANYTVNLSDKLTQDSLTTRVDHALGNNDRVFGRYNVIRAPQDIASAYPDRIADTRAGIRENKIHAALGSWMHNFTPVLLNEVRYAYSRRLAINRAAGTGSGFNGKIGLRGVDESAFPIIAVTGQSGFSVSPNERIQTPILTHHLVDNLTWIKGKHTIKTGFEMRYSLNKDEFSQSGGGSFTFNDRGTRSGMAAFLLGWTTSAGQSKPDLLEARTDYYGFYVQDDWKVARNLTFNLGLRWELDTPRWERIDNRQSGFNGTAINPVSGTPGVVTFSGRDGLGKYAHPFDRNNLAPRFGFAWKPGSRTVVRGGYGINYLGSYFGAVVNTLSQGFGSNFSFTSPDGGLTPAFLFRTGLPTGTREPIGPAWGAVRVGQAPRSAPDFISQNHVNGYSQQYNLTVQRELAGNMLLEAAYLGNLGRKLGGAAVNINVIPLVNGRGPATQSQTARLFPQFNAVNRLTPNWGSSTYHAMNLKVERRYANGFNLLANYTWAKFLDNIEGGSEFAGGEGNGYTHPELRSLDRSYSGNDIRHRFIGSSVYELPIGKGKPVDPGHPVWNGIVGGWSIGTIAEFFSGAPWGAIEQTNLTNTFAGSPRPNLTCDPRLAGGRTRGEALNQWFNTACFAGPALGAFGNAARAVGFGPGQVNIDLSVNKRWAIREKYGLLFRSDFYNLPNRPNFNVPAAVRGRGDFGRITTTRGTGRQIQLSMRFEF